ncbi:hypothetical protein ABIE91_009071 [Bradyrhizobium elkanii]
MAPLVLPDAFTAVALIKTNGLAFAGIQHRLNKPEKGCAGGAAEPVLLDLWR